MRNCASEGALSANPGSRDSGFNAARCPGMTAVKISRLCLSLRLALPLAGPPSLFDLDRDRQRFRTSAITGAAHRRGAEVVEPDGDTGMGVGSAEAVGGIEADPA